jgi:hypothetical protein
MNHHGARVCGDCHKNPNDYKVFQCIDCHNDKANLDQKHKGRAGYSYSSAACYQCHPQGRN